MADHDKIPEDFRRAVAGWSMAEIVNAIPKDAPEYQLALDAITEAEKDADCSRCKRTISDTAEDMPTDITGGKRGPFWGTLKVQVTSPLLAAHSDFLLCVKCGEGLFEYLLPEVNVAELRKKIKGKYLS